MKLYATPADLRKYQALVVQDCEFNRTVLLSRSAATVPESASKRLERFVALAQTEGNFRIGPPGEAPPVATVPFKAAVVLVEDGGEWCRVTYSNSEGWIACRLLASKVPVAMSPSKAKRNPDPVDKEEQAGWVGNLICLTMVGLVVFGLASKLWWALARCEICGNKITRTAWTWTLDGKRTTVCPEFNARLRRRNSRSHLGP